MLAAMPTISARRAFVCGRAPACSSAIQAVAVAVTAPTARPLSDAGDEQPGQVAPEHEGHGGQRGQGQARQQHALASVDVGEVADEEQRDRDADGVGGEDGGDRERSEPVTRGVEAVERRRESGVRHHDHQGERDRPEPAVVVEELGHAHTLAHATIAFNACSLLLPSRKVMAGMELRQLEAFVAAADEGGITRAAGRLHIVQSAVSASLRRLEAELGRAAVRAPGARRDADRRRPRAAPPRPRGAGRRRGRARGGRRRPRRPARARAPRDHAVAVAAGLAGQRAGRAARVPRPPSGGRAAGRPPERRFGRDGAAGGRGRARPRVRRAARRAARGRR